jgi:glutaredoxin
MWMLDLAKTLLGSAEAKPMASRILLFTQSGCLSCELMKVFLEARGLAFDERDTSSDSAARDEMLEKYGTSTTPTVVVVTDSGAEVIEGFDHTRLDQFLPAA